MSVQKRRAFAGFFETIGSAVAAAAAVRNRVQPDARDLRSLGIDPEQFRRIGS